MTIVLRRFHGISFINKTEKNAIGQEFWLSEVNLMYSLEWWFHTAMIYILTHASTFRAFWHSNMIIKFTFGLKLVSKSYFMVAKLDALCRSTLNQMRLSFLCVHFGCGYSYREDDSFSFCLLYV